MQVNELDGILETGGVGTWMTMVGGKFLVFGDCGGGLYSVSLYMRLSWRRFGYWWLIIWFLGFAKPVGAQAPRASGMMPLNRLGVSYQKAVGVDVGFGAYNILFGRKKTSFFDVSVGAESVFAKRFALVPKVNVDAGTPIWALGGMTIGGGMDAGWYTDFSTGGIRLTPKVGVTAGSIIRLYYGYHWFDRAWRPEPIGRHRISLEVNIAAFHDFKIGL